MSDLYESTDDAYFLELVSVIKIEAFITHLFEATNGDGRVLMELANQIAGVELAFQNRTSTQELQGSPFLPE